MANIERIERRLKLHDVRVLLAVIQEGSMSKAAERLSTSQPAISRSILDLEHTLGVRLLDRSPRGIEPTHYGRAIAKRGIAAFDELRQGVKDIEFLADPSGGELRIGCTEAVAAGPAFAVMDRLMRQYPRIVFNVVTGGEAALYRHLADRNVELVMSATSIPMPETYVVESLFADSLVVVAGLQNPWTRRRKIELSELLNERWTLLPADTAPGALIVEVFRANGLEPPKTSVVTASLNLRNRLLATGRFLTMQSGYTLAPASENPLLKALPVKLQSLQRSIAILTLRNRTLSPLAELFIKTARAIVKPLAKTR
jgi:DNA-binding transcriptional LysR family regulator